MKPVKVKGQVFWSRHSEPYDDGRYGVDIGQLSEAAVEKLQDDAMLDVKHKDTQQFYVTCKSNFPIKMVDSEGNEIEDFSINLHLHPSQWVQVIPQLDSTVFDDSHLSRRLIDFKRF